MGFCSSPYRSRNTMVAAWNFLIRSMGTHQLENAFQLVGRCNGMQAWHCPHTMAILQCVCHALLIVKMYWYDSFQDRFALVRAEDLEMCSLRFLIHAVCKHSSWFYQCSVL